jgi:hypothetical protein
MIVDPGELRPTAQFRRGVRPLFLLSSHGSGAGPWSYAPMTKPSTACDLLRDGASGLSAHSWSACGREIRGCGGVAAGSADTYVSSKILRKLEKKAPREPIILMGLIPACQRTARLC